MNTDGSMTFDELCKAVDSLHAYDTGCVDSGVHDDQLKERVRDQLVAGGQVLMWRVLLSLDLQPESRSEGYGWEDAAETAAWIEGLTDMEFDPGVVMPDG